ncbi:RT0821/Lpp0805 family surface protein [Mesorhizobium sp. CAU 1741]|uniref:RT0821/Lpp0805 family surface protein n=1 Tax=Mesorhizobium sp. CAU 1741 TaxID=3140366 RepID=UPI00325B9075
MIDPRTCVELTGECRLARKAQAFGGWGRRLFLWFSPRMLVPIVTCVPLVACGTSSFSIEDAVPDRSIVTGSISQDAPPEIDAVRLSDEATIRNAVSSAIVDEVGPDGIGWANAGTGSRGSIRQVQENRQDGYLCRQFVASRESFDGIHLFRGETCLGPSRIWVMRAFDAVE